MDYEDKNMICMGALLLMAIVIPLPYVGCWIALAIAIAVVIVCKRKDTK